MTHPNPYRAPAAALEDAAASGAAHRPIGLAIFAVVQATASLAMALSAPWVLASFRELFVGFSMNLPAITRFIVSYPYIWWLPALIGTAVAFWVVRRARVPPAELHHMRIAVKLTSGVIALATGFAVWALYAPIFTLAEPV